MMQHKLWLNCMVIFDNSIITKLKIVCTHTMYRRRVCAAQINHGISCNNHPWKLHSFLAITGISRSHDRIARETERRTETRARICRKGIRDAEGGPQLGGQRRHVSFVRESHYRAWERLPGSFARIRTRLKAP